jgi:hypothetical protein
MASMENDAPGGADLALIQQEAAQTVEGMRQAEIRGICRLRMERTA